MKATTAVKALKLRENPTQQPTITQQEAQATHLSFSAFRRPPGIERPALPGDVKPGVGARQPTSLSPACNRSCPNRPQIRRKNGLAVSDFILAGNRAHVASQVLHKAELQRRLRLRFHHLPRLFLRALRSCGTRQLLQLASLITINRVLDGKQRIHQIPVATSSVPASYDRVLYVNQTFLYKPVNIFPHGIR